MSVDEKKMLADFEVLLVIGATVDEALAEIARSYRYTVEHARFVVSDKLGDLQDYAWKIAIRK